MTTIGHNGGPPLADPSEEALREISDLFGEAVNFADGEPIDSVDMHDAITLLYDRIHESGKRADALRASEKKPHDDAAAAVQAKYKPALAKVNQAKAALGELLAAWRKRIADEKAAAAKRKADEAAKVKAEAEAAIRATSGNLEARVAAEELLAHAKSVEKDAKRADKAATTGTGLRSVWVATLVDEGLALDWAFDRAPDDFKALVQRMADAVVRAGVRVVPGFKVEETKVAN